MPDAKTFFASTAAERVASLTPDQFRQAARLRGFDTGAGMSSRRGGRAGFRQRRGGVIPLIANLIKQDQRVRALKQRRVLEDKLTLAEIDRQAEAMFGRKRSQAERRAEILRQNPGLAGGHLGTPEELKALGKRGRRGRRGVTLRGLPGLAVGHTSAMAASNFQRKRPFTQVVKREKKGTGMWGGHFETADQLDGLDRPAQRRGRMFTTLRHPHTPDMSARFFTSPTSFDFLPKFAKQRAALGVRKARLQRVRIAGARATKRSNKRFEKKGGGSARGGQGFPRDAQGRFLPRDFRLRSGFRRTLIPRRVRGVRRSMPPFF